MSVFQYIEERMCETQPESYLDVARELYYYGLSLVAWDLTTAE